MVDSAAVAGWAPKAANGSSKSSATIKDFLRLRMDFFPSGCGFLDSGSGSERRRTGGTGGRLAAHLFLALQRASSSAPPQQRLRFCPPGLAPGDDSGVCFIHQGGPEAGPKTRNDSEGPYRPGRSSRLSSPAAMLSPTWPCRLSGCSAIELLEPPTSTLPPAPTPIAALPCAPA